MAALGLWDHLKASSTREADPKLSRGESHQNIGRSNN